MALTRATFDSLIAKIDERAKEVRWSEALPPDTPAVMVVDNVTVTVLS